MRREQTSIANCKSTRELGALFWDTIYILSLLNSSHYNTAQDSSHFYGNVSWQSQRILCYVGSHNTDLYMYIWCTLCYITNLKTTRFWIFNWISGCIYYCKFNLWLPIKHISYMLPAMKSPFFSADQIQMHYMKLKAGFKKHGH